jgi:excinuclease ABC subunit C
MEKYFYKDAPQACGVYLMKDSDGNVIYVGKAKNLKKRLTSYFKNSEKRYQIGFLLKKVDHIEYIITNNEKEALILENNLIKKFNPRYNIQLKDDKNYLCIKIDMKKPFPKIEFVRRIEDKDALYFGPYPSARKIREIIANLHKIFPLRKCNETTFNKRTVPCLYFEMGQCIAPCIDKEHKKEEYKNILNNVILFLEGTKTNKIKNLLKKEMWLASERQDFEKAAFIRDTLYGIDEFLKSQGIQSSYLKNIDVIGTFDALDNLNVSILYIRGGKLIHKKDFTLKKPVSKEESLEAFIISYYQGNVIIPDEIIVEEIIENKQEIEQILSNIKGKKVKIKHPYNKQTEQLMRMAKLNASSFSPQSQDSLVVIKNTFGLPKIPERIECYDATHLHGLKNACVMVVFENGGLAKEAYRIFNISEKGFDDYKALYEALRRRLEHKEWKFPDIIVLDGGKGQLSVGKKVLEDMNISDIFLMAIAKDEKNSIYIVGRKNPLILKDNNQGLKLLLKLREEAHRFANMHLKRRLKKYFYE